MDTYDHADV